MNIRTKKALFSLFVLAMGVNIAFAQDDLDKLLKNSVEDGNKLVKGYVDPFMKSFSLGLNQGWYNTAKPHKIAGVDLTITASAMFIPNDKLFYNVANLDLQRVEMDASSPDYPKAPTIFGPANAPVYRDKESGETFEGPEGLDVKGEIGYSIAPVPMATLGFGLPKGTDIKFRFCPTIDIGDDGTFDLFGIGVMHNIKQYIPVVKHMPFDLSAFVGYTRLNLNYKYDGGEVAGENQRGVFAMNATTIQGVISRKFSVITFYGGLGYNIARSNIAIKGTFDINEDGDTDDAGEKNPIDQKFAASGPRATAGFRLKLAVFTIHADYTLQKYSSVSAGFGICVR